MSEISCPQCGTVMIRYGGRMMASGKFDKLFYCKTHGTWCDWSIRNTRRKLRITNHNIYI